MRVHTVEGTNLIMMVPEPSVVFFTFELQNWVENVQANFLKTTADQKTKTSKNKIAHFIYYFNFIITLYRFHYFNIYYYSKF